MSLTATTLSAAVTATDTTIPVAANTGATAPNFTTGSGVTYAYCGQELMLVLSLIGTKAVTVQRGVGGTIAASHASSAALNFGSAADFSGQVPAAQNFRTYYGTLPVPLRASAAQLTSVVATASSADVTSDVKAALIEVMNTLVAMGVWKGSA